MNKKNFEIELAYHAFIKKIYWWFLFFLVLIEAIVLRINYVGLGQKDLFSSVFTLLLASTVPVSIFIRLFFFVRPRIFSKYFVDSKKIRVRFRKKCREYDFSNIEKIGISFVSPRFFGGFSVHMKSGQVLRFWGFLDGNHKILTQIFGFNSSLGEKKMIEKYRIASELVEVSWKRIRERFLTWQVLLLKYFVVPTAIAAYVNLNRMNIVANPNPLEAFLKDWIFSLILVWIVAAIVNSLEERILNQLLIRSGEVDVSRRDIKKESYIHWSFQVVFVVLILGIVYFVMTTGLYF